MAWLEGDLKIFAAGLAIGGEWNLGEVASSGIAVCYYDAGQFDHFYIKFTKPIAEFSLGQFQETVIIVGKYGVIYPTEATKHSLTEIIVYADISKEDDGILIAGKENGYLTYATGKLIPKFVASLYVTELMNIVKLAYIWDKVTTSTQYSAVQQIDLYYTGLSTLLLHDAVTIQGSKQQITDKVELSYFKT